MAVTHFVFTIMCVAVLAGKATSDKNKLMLFLVDGFRWDYFEKPEMRDAPGFRRLMRGGSKALSLEPINPTNSYPNYYSLMTGLYAESHGMVGNYMYDEKHGTYFLIGTNPEQYHSYWWDDGEPLWVTAERQGQRVYMYQWPGCEVEIRGYRPTYCKTYSGVPSLGDLETGILEGLQLLKNDSADIVAIYVEVIDDTGHTYGPQSDELNRQLTELDKRFDQLVTQLEKNQLQDKVDILIFSDHGMTDMFPSRVVNISNHVDMADVEVILMSGSLVYIWPKTNKGEKIYADLKLTKNTHFEVFFKDRQPLIPEHWHYRHHYRVPPILLTAEPGWFIVTPTQPNLGVSRGIHGYDVKLTADMNGILLAYGPSFKKNYVTHDPVKAVDIYQMMCNLLNIRASPNNGTLSHTSGMLATSGSNSFRSGLILMVWTYILTSIMI
ncbi:hypothetical protein ScPMuIL_012423 [Solemya velum]